MSKLVGYDKKESQLYIKKEGMSDQSTFRESAPNTFCLNSAPMSTVVL